MVRSRSTDFVLQSTGGQFCDFVGAQQNEASQLRVKANLSGMQGGAWVGALAARLDFARWAGM